MQESLAIIEISDPIEFKYTFKLSAPRINSFF